MESVDLIRSLERSSGTLKKNVSDLSKSDLEKLWLTPKQVARFGHWMDKIRDMEYGGDEKIITSRFYVRF